MAREDQKLRSDSVRQAILDTAMEIGLQEGFEAATLRKIAAKMKYSTGVVYHYFTDKQEIIDAVEAAESDWMRSVVMGLLDETKSAVENAVTVFHRIMRLALEEPEKFNLIVLHKYSRHRPGMPEWVPYLRDSLQKDMEAGRLREMDAQKAAFSIWSSFLGFNLMVSRLPGITPEQAEQMFQAQVDLILKGILI